MKKKLLIIIPLLVVAIAVGIIFGVAVPKSEWAKDSGDTEELY